MTRKRAGVVVWLIGMAVCAAQVAHTRFVADLSFFLPNAPTSEQQLLVDQLRTGASSRVIFIGIEGSDAHVRAQLSQALATAIAADRRFTNVVNGSRDVNQHEREFLMRYRYVLSQEVSPGRFTVQGLRSAIGESVELLASPAGLLVKSLITQDPTGELLAVLERIRPSEGPRVHDGVWVSPDGARALLVARTRADGADIDAQALGMSAIQGAFNAIATKAGADATRTRLVMTGPGVFSVRARAMIVHDVTRLTTISAAVIMVLLLVVYRSPLALALGFLPVVSGALAGIAAVSLAFGVVHGITLGFGTTLIGEAIDYSIYYFVQGQRAEGETDDSARFFWPTIRLGVLTSIAGFSALLLSGLPGLAQLGLYSIIGLAAAATVTRFVLPQLLPQRLRIRDLSAAGVKIATIASQATRLRVAVVVLSVASLAVLWNHRNALWDSELGSLNPITVEDRALDAELRASIGASDARTMIVVQGSSADEALAAAERVGQRLDPLVAAGKLGGYESAAQLLPPIATQRARLESLPEGDTLRSRLATALQDLPLRAARLEPFVLDVERARAEGMVTRDRFAGSALDAVLDGLLFADSRGHWNAIVSLRAPAVTNATIDLEGIRAMVGTLPGARVLDIKAEADRLYANYFRRATLTSALGFIVIVLLLGGVLREPRRVASVMAPFVAGILVVAAWHVLSGTRLTIFHLVGLLLVAAVGSNYALFFDRIAGRADATSGATIASLALANVTTVVGFGTLAWSDIPVLNAIGSSVAAGTFMTLLFSAMLAKLGPISPWGNGRIPPGHDMT
ncbi:MAG: MMPL family transporter [Pseudomonadota bacterium]|nr:MMPL family transporter [Pseudomonadota bacterium]